jgi:hypothetical protein
VAPAPVRQWPRAPAGPVRLGASRRPLLALAAGCLLVAIGAGLIAAHVTVFALDETVIEQSAVHYTSGLPHTLLHDPDARATSRLYPLVLSIVFRLFDGATAIQAAHVLSVLLFISAAVPVYLMARTLLRSRWYAAAGALLSIAVPWLTISSALFEENLAYPLFWWAMLACCYALWRPTPRGDAIALIAIGLAVITRVQLTSLFVGYVLAAAVTCTWRAWGTAGTRARLSAVARRLLRGHPFTVAVCVAAAAVLLYVRLFTEWHYHFERLFGSYSNVIIRSTLPPNILEAVLVEVIALALGVGLLPAIISGAWYVRRLSALREDRTSVHLLGAGIMLATFVLLTAIAQFGYLGAATEERYFLYVVPAFWLGTFAALEHGRVRRSDFVLAAAALAAVYASIPLVRTLNGETAFLAPVEAVVPHVLAGGTSSAVIAGLTLQDVLALVAVLAGLLTVAAWRRSRRVRLTWGVGVAALVQLLIAGYAFAVIDGQVPAIAGRTSGAVGPLGWISGHAGGSDVTWLDNGALEPDPHGGAPLSVDHMRIALFWNSSLRGWASVSQLALPAPEWPMSALPHPAPFAVQTSTGLLAPRAPAPAIGEVVETTDSPFLQLAGRVIASSPDRSAPLALMAPTRPLRALWLTTGLQAERYVLAGTPVALYAFAPSPGTASAESVTLTIAPPPAPAPTTATAAGPAAGASRSGTAQQALMTVRLGTVSRTLALPAGGPVQTVSLPACFGARGGALTGAIEVRRAVSESTVGLGGSLDAVTIAPAGAPMAVRCGRG